MSDGHSIVLPIFVKPEKSASDGDDCIEIPAEVEDLEACLDESRKNRVGLLRLNGVGNILDKQFSTSEQGVQKRVSLSSPTLKASLN